jgi:hypothetical protein
VEENQEQVKEDCVEENTLATKRKVAVLRHNDADGFGAAYAIWKALKDTCESLFIPVQYGQAVPWDELNAFKPEKIFIVDFSYSPDRLTLMQATITNDLTVIDHHKSALPELQAWLPNESVNPGAGSYFFDLERSGCGLTWDLFHLDESWVAEDHGSDTVQPSAPMPAILQYVQDRDLWKFELENSKEINAYIATMPEDFQEWDDFYLPEAYTAGKAVLAFQKGQIERRLKDVVMVDVHEDDGYAISKRDGRWCVSPDASISPSDCKKYIVPFVNASENQSELGEAMCRAYPDSPFSVSYCDRPDGKRSYSLRSRNGFDVSEVCKAFGGGGHHKEGKGGAGGFTLSAPDII